MEYNFKTLNPDVASALNELKETISYTGIDVEKLVMDYTMTLHENSHKEATLQASILTLREWAKENEFLIRQIMAMPGYNGNLQAVCPLVVPFNRTNNMLECSVNRIWDKLFKKGDACLSRKNEEGKTLEDKVKEEMSDIPLYVKVSDLPVQGGKVKKSFCEFTSDGYSRKSVDNKQKANELISVFRHYNSSRLDEEHANEINRIMPEIDAKEGMKTTRAFGKVIRLLGLEDKSKGSIYGKFFVADYCEIMREGGAKYTYVISVHPVDYLKMSIGEFTSCHSIKNQGGWQSGTISYMLDNVSIITYAIKNDQETTDRLTGEVVTGEQRPELFSKVYRNVFFWDKEHRLIQSRVYPQGNDGCADVFSAFRHKMQSQISKANGWDENVWTKRNDRHMKFAVHGTGATNYPDWKYSYMGANLSTPNHLNDEYSKSTMVIGAKPMCVVCGERHSNTSRLTCDEHRWLS